MKYNKFYRLVRRGLITDAGLDKALEESRSAGTAVEDVLLKSGIPRHELLLSLSEHYNLPFVEYDEDLVISREITRDLDLEELKELLWVPVSVGHGSAEVIAYDLESPELVSHIRNTLGVDDIRFTFALPADIVRIIENHQDVNPGFPPCAGRTPLAKTRTFLANRRSLFACRRTWFAKGRTGLAFLRTGISFITVSMLIARVFGLGYLLIIEAPLLTSGLVMVVDGILWYLPARKAGAKFRSCASTVPTWGTTVLKTENPGPDPDFVRTGPVPGADKLRSHWDNLSPVMRRRYLASDRTDLAEERTVLACFRTNMARARTGLAFARTGFAFSGVGIAMLRRFHEGPWNIFDFTLIITGVLMVMEGFYWYFPGRRAGEQGDKSVRAAGEKATIWDFVFPPEHKHPEPSDMGFLGALSMRASYSPGIWGTTGHALERTLLADRRNVMARLRTVMARSRTGLAFIRTGMSLSAVGAGLLVYFGAGNGIWTLFESALVVVGLLFITDGLYWHLPAEKTRKQLPYCFGGMEIAVPDYGVPNVYWGKTVFEHDDV
jgi:uncharacterized membrane protein YidH (DUF202 family)